jgi:hypothetical protein
MASASGDGGVPHLAAQRFGAFGHPSARGRAIRSSVHRVAAQRGTDVAQRRSLPDVELLDTSSHPRLEGLPVQQPEPSAKRFRPVDAEDLQVMLVRRCGLAGKTGLPHRPGAVGTNVRIADHGTSQPKVIADATERVGGALFSATTVASPARG